MQARNRSISIPGVPTAPRVSSHAAARARVLRTRSVRRPKQPRVTMRMSATELDDPAPARAHSPAAFSRGEARARIGPPFLSPPRPDSRRLVVLAATQLKVGMLVLYNGKPHRVATVMHRTPGNLRGFVQAKLVNIENASNQEVRFSTDDKLERAILDEH